MKHARYSASGSKRWINCPASLKAEEDYADKFPTEENTSIYALEGTACHELLERVFDEESTLGVPADANNYLGEIITVEGTDFTVNDEMVDSVNSFVKYVKDIYTPDTSKVAYASEMRVSFDDIADGGFGTCDFFLYDGVTNAVHVIDLKYGRGVKEDATANSQLSLYAWGIWRYIKENKPEMADISKFVLHIVQPRIDNYSRYEISAKDMLRFSQHIKSAVAKTQDKKAPRFAGEHCRFCKAKSDCWTYKNSIESMTMMSFGAVPDANAIDVPKLSDEEKVALLDNIDKIKELEKCYRDHLFNRLRGGDTIKGVKMITSKKNKKWNDTAIPLLVSKYGNDVLKEPVLVLRPVSEVKRIVGDDVEEYRHIPKGMPVLALDSEPGEPMDTTQDLGFKKLN